MSNARKDDSNVAQSSWPLLLGRLFAMQIYQAAKPLVHRVDARAKTFERHRFCHLRRQLPSGIAGAKRRLGVIGRDLTRRSLRAASRKHHRRALGHASECQVPRDHPLLPRHANQVSFQGDD